MSPIEQPDYEKAAEDLIARAEFEAAKLSDTQRDLFWSYLQMRCREQLPKHWDNDE